MRICDFRNLTSDARLGPKDHKKNMFKGTVSTDFTPIFPHSNLYEPFIHKLKYDKTRTS